MLGIRGYTFVRQQLVSGGVEFYIAASPSQIVCPCCKSGNVTGKGGKERRFRSLPFGRKHVTIVLWMGYLVIYHFPFPKSTLIATSDNVSYVLLF